MTNTTSDPAASGTPTPEAERAHDARRQGLGMLTWSLGGLAVFLLTASGWTLIRALQNPDVRLKPQWVAEGRGFDHSFWSPMLLTIVIGSLLVGWVLWRAFQRLRAGEDLYAERFGKGLRRNREAHLTNGEKA